MRVHTIRHVLRGNNIISYVVVLVYGAYACVPWFIIHLLYFLRQSNRFSSIRRRSPCNLKIMVIAVSKAVCRVVCIVECFNRLSLSIT